MKTRNAKVIKVCLILYFVILILYIGRNVLFTDLLDFAKAGKDAVSHDFSRDWTIDATEESFDLKDISAGTFGGSYVASKRLPELMLETDCIYLSTSNLKFDVYVDDARVYSYDTKENLTGLGDGVSYHMIGLGSKDAGRTLRFEASTSFENGRGGRFNEVYYGSADAFRYYILRSNFAAGSLSVLMLFFGLAVMVWFFVVYKKAPTFRPIWAVGVSAVLFGAWNLADTGLPQLLAGTVYSCREIVYGIPLLAAFPLIYFVSHVTKRKRGLFIFLSFAISVLGFGWLLFSRYAFGKDLHTMTVSLYLSYLSELTLLIVLLVDNELYCRKKKISSNLMYFYVGAGILAVTCIIDIVRYSVGKKVSIGRGSWFRFGLVLFFIFMAVQLFVWWTSEKTSLERDRFINRLLQYVTDEGDPETKINKVLEYLCTVLKADRAYIFEDNRDGTFDNTYEYCAKGVTPEIDNLKGLPYKGVIDAWYQEYEKGGHVLIYDIEKYRNENEKMYELLKPQGIKTLVSGPLVLDGVYLGFFGLDNPPAERMEEISEIMKLLMYFLASMISQRDGHRRLVEYSYKDALTGAGNRRAVKRFETERLDTTRSYGIVMCDINGLKAVNDNEGHAAGDELIKTVASCIAKVFGIENVYRMGGDEFSVYAYADSKAAFEEKVGELRSMISENGARMAIGYSFAEGGDPDYNARRLEADNKMYEEKRDFYRDGNDRRMSRT